MPESLPSIFSIKIGVILFIAPQIIQVLLLKFKNNSMIVVVYAYVVLLELLSVLLRLSPV